MTEPVEELDLYFVRHGQSRMNVPDGYDKPKSELTPVEFVDPVLTERGERQAELLGERLSDVSFDCILSSPLRRTVQTALAVAERQGVCRTVRIMPELTERGVPLDYAGYDFSGLNNMFGGRLCADDAVARRRTAALSNDDNDDVFQRKRAADVISKLRSEYHNGEKVLVVGHACFNTDLILHALGIENNTVFDPEFTNTSVSRIIFYRRGTGSFGLDIRLCCLNDTSHLFRK